MGFFSWDTRQPERGRGWVELDGCRGRCGKCGNSGRHWLWVVKPEYPNGGDGLADRRRPVLWRLENVCARKWDRRSGCLTWPGEWSGVEWKAW